MRQEDQRDPYAPPPRHRDRSGAVVRVVLVAALLGLAVWGYTEFNEGPGLTAETPQDEQTLADSSLDALPAEPVLSEPADAPVEPEGNQPAPPPSGR